MLFLNRHGREKALRENVQQGAIFRRQCSHNVVEQAEVLWIGPDPAGIPHVRYQVSYVGSDFAEEQSTRTLALASFAAMYGLQRNGLAGLLSLG